MTDPIEQARPAGRWNEKHSYWRLPDGLYFMLPDSVEQAILRYRPDVVRLVEAARRLANDEMAHAMMGLCPDPEQPDSRDPSCPACLTLAALVPFTTEEPT